MLAKTRTDDELLADILAEAHRQARNGCMPSLRQWDQRRLANIPSRGNIHKRLGLTLRDIGDMIGLAPHQRESRPPTTTAADLERHVAQGAELADWNSRYHATLHALPTPTRVEQVMGRTLAGEPCIIRREYWMLR